ncbi:hypothetical protein PIROE2DRAFT_9255 [Piromyces sp. E2]|nr:hypothetical protein PIROE2DRAFT_9255 [Piromyces sp. E2]|eukprot:OUM64090.1 hypothetical protein PIROE2DRAFT_9255 [Piromyces sp. E2]
MFNDNDGGGGGGGDDNDDNNNNIYENTKTQNKINNVTFGVNTGECLSLLGQNEADLCETNIANLSLGYCSQHDSLWQLLTVKETVEFYLNIYGYPSSMDSFTRRYMWELILKLKNICKTATILINIAIRLQRAASSIAALCNRIAILIKERLVCIDTTKMNHSNTFNIGQFN